MAGTAVSGRVAAHSSKLLAGFQSMTSQGLIMLSNVEREHLLQQISSRSVGHQGAEMRLKPVQLRC